MVQFTLHTVFMFGCLLKVWFCLLRSLAAGGGLGASLGGDDARGEAVASLTTNSSSHLVLEGD